MSLNTKKKIFSFSFSLNSIVKLIRNRKQTTLQNHIKIKNARFTLTNKNLKISHTNKKKTPEMYDSNKKLPPMSIDKCEISSAEVESLFSNFPSIPFTSISDPPPLLLQIEHSIKWKNRIF